MYQKKSIILIEFAYFNEIFMYGIQPMYSFYNSAKVYSRQSVSFQIVNKKQLQIWSLYLS